MFGDRVLRTTELFSVGHGSRLNCRAPLRASLPTCPGLPHSVPRYRTCDHPSRNEYSDSVGSLSARCLAFHSQVSFSTHHHSTALLIKLSPLKLSDGQRDPQSPSHTIRPLGRDQDPTAQHTWQFLNVTFIDSLSPEPATSQQALDFYHRSTVGRLSVVLQETAFLAQKDALESLRCVLAQAPVPQLSSKSNGRACLSVCLPRLQLLRQTAIVTTAQWTFYQLWTTLVGSMCSFPGYATGICSCHRS